MNKPLALVAYERLLPGSQLLHRLSDLGYRVQSVANYAKLVDTAREEKPLVLVMDLKTTKTSSLEVIQSLKANADTAHIPILGFVPPNGGQIEAEGFKAGASLVALDDALIPQLPQLLDQILAID